MTNYWDRITYKLYGVPLITDTVSSLSFATNTVPVLGSMATAVGDKPTTIGEPILSKVLPLTTSTLFKAVVINTSPDLGCTLDQMDAVMSLQIFLFFYY